MASVSASASQASFPSTEVTQSTSCTDKFLSMHTAADALPDVLYNVTTNGKGAAMVLLGGYVVLAMLWIPFWLLSFLVTEVGVYVGLVLSVVTIGRGVLRMIAFPGCSHRVGGEIEKEFKKYSVRMIEASANCVGDWALAMSSDGSDISEGELRASRARAFSSRDNILSVYMTVLTYLLEHDGIGNRDNAEANCEFRREIGVNSFGNNRLVGDVGNLSLTGLDDGAKADGETLRGLIKAVLDLSHGLEEAVKKNSGSDRDAVNEAARVALAAVFKLRDFTSVLTSSDGPSQDVGDDGTEESNLGVLKSAASSILPMIIPPPPTSIFVLDVVRGCALSRYKNARQIWIPRPHGTGMLDAIYIPSPRTAATEDGTVKCVLYCNPNAGLCEVATGINLNGGNVHGTQANNNSVKHASWTDFYLDNGYDICVFNYAGFGRSYGVGTCGRNSNKHKTVPSIHNASTLSKLCNLVASVMMDFKPSPSTLKQDALTVANYLLDVIPVSNLVLHGESIGGMAAASAADNLCKTRAMATVTHGSGRSHDDEFHLTTTVKTADQQEGLSLLLICDRTFCNLEAVAQKLVGSWTSVAINALAPFWNTDVANDFLSTTCPKIVANDAADAIIADSSSLRSGIALSKEFLRGNTRRAGWTVESPIEYRMADYENRGVDNIHGSLNKNGVGPPIWPADKHITMREAFHFAACVKRIGKLATVAKRSLKGRTKRLDLGGGEDEDDGIELSLLVNRDGGSDTDGHNHLLNIVPVNDNNNTIDLLMETWSVLACCDNLCGSTLGFVTKSGFDWTVSWLGSAVTYGPQAVAATAERRMKSNKTIKSNEDDFKIIPGDFEIEKGIWAGEHDGDEDRVRMRPLSIPQVLSSLKKVFDLHCRRRDAGPLQDIERELRYCIGMLEYVTDRISFKFIAAAALDVRHFRGDCDEAPVGTFLNLHCGHNNIYSMEEQKALRVLLGEVFEAKSS